VSLYTDTSALIKRYVREAGSEQVTATFDEYPIIVTSAITQVEMASAMSKALRMGWLDESEAAQAWQDFLSHWSSYTRLPASSGIVERAVSLAWRHGLRAYDSIHLASAMAWQGMTGSEVTFACYDQNLIKAARQEGLRVWPA
jgi:predicted nucleic acid-binding protein